MKAFLANVALIPFILTVCNCNPDKMNTKCNTIEEIRLCADIKPSFKASEEVPIRLRLHNRSKGVCIFPTITNDLPGCIIEIVNLSGDSCEYTPVGENLISQNRELTRVIRAVLKPGEKQSWSPDLAECFVLPPGKYKASITLGIGEPVVTLRVENLEFRIRQK